MADVTVYGDASAGTNIANWLQGPYWVSPSTGYIFLSGPSDYDVHCYKTSDSGASWSEADAADCPTSTSGYNLLAGFASWFDQETPGDSGTKIHLAYVDDDNATYSNVKYVYFDTSTDQWSSPVTVRTGEDSATDWQKWLALTKSVGGVLFIAGHTNSGTVYMYRSTDGSSWSLKTGPGEATADRYNLFCANLADTNDIWCLFHDADANALTLKTYDDSGNSWSETSSIQSATENSSYPIRFFDGAIRHSDGHLLAVCWTGHDAVTADLLAWDITDAGTITAKANVITDHDDCAYCGLLINQQNNDVYIAYLGNEDGSQTMGSLVSAFYKKSTDGMANWGSQTAYSSGTADDYRVISGGRTVGDAGGRWMPAWFDDDDNDIFVNDGNDVEIAAAAGGDPEGRLKGGKLIRGGLLRGGVLAA